MTTRILSKLLTVQTEKQKLEVPITESTFIRQQLPFLWKYTYTRICAYIHGDEVTHTQVFFVIPLFHLSD